MTSVHVCPKCFDLVECMNTFKWHWQNCIKSNLVKIHTWTQYQKAYRSSGGLGSSPEMIWTPYRWQDGVWMDACCHGHAASPTAVFTAPGITSALWLAASLSPDIVHLFPLVRRCGSGAWSWFLISHWSEACGAECRPWAVIGREARCCSAGCPRLRQRHI